jgi:hypothetical protein
MMRLGSRWTRGWRCKLFQVHMGRTDFRVWVVGRVARAPDRGETSARGAVCGRRTQPER